MDNTLNLIPGQNYSVKKEFADYDGIIHPVGESWTYEGTRFVPYEDGLTLHLSINNKAITYRLQWRNESQAHIIDNFKDFVEHC